MQTMHVTIVDLKGALPRVYWGKAFLLSSVLGLFGAAVASAAYFALTYQFSPLAALIGFGGPFITVGSGIARTLAHAKQTAR
jgi:hypothetical protein